MFHVEHSRTEWLWLPWPPTANNSKIPVRYGKRARMISTDELRAYHTLAKFTILKAHIKPLDPPYQVTVVFHPPKNVNRFDLGNYEKAPVDALKKGGLISDDSKINRLILLRGEKLGRGIVSVEIKEIEHALEKARPALYVAIGR